MNAIAKLDGCTNAKLRRLNRIVSRHYDQQIAPTGLKMTQYSLICHVLELGPVRPVDLARTMAIDASTLTRNLKPLVTAGWLSNDVGEDARSHLVTITESGREKRSTVQTQWRSAQLSMNELLGIERVKVLHRHLDECTEVLRLAGLREQGHPDD